MKRIFLYVLSTAIYHIAYTQNIGIGTNNPHASALLELNSTNKGLLLPRVNDTSTVNNPAKGLIVYTNSNNKLWYYNGVRWQQAAANATGTDGIWYELNDSTAATKKSFISINYDESLVEPKANLQVTGDLLILGKLLYSNKIPTPAQTYTMTSNAVPVIIPNADSVFSILDPGGNGNYSNNNIGNVLISSVQNQVGLKVSSSAADFGIGAGDTIWFSPNGFPTCKTNFTHRISATSINPAEILLGSSTRYITFQSNADGVNGKGFKLTCTRLFQTTPVKNQHTVGNSLAFNATNGSFAAGFNVNAITPGGKIATAIGYGNSATGDYSTAIGRAVKAEGLNSMALGYNSEAPGTDAMAIGMGAYAYGNQSIAMGNSSSAEGDFSTTMGYQTAAFGNYSMAMGASSQTSGAYSSTLGLGNLARGYAGTVVGMYNNVITSAQTSVVGTTPLFIVGNGDNGVNRSNAMVVFKNGRVGIGTTLTPVANLQIEGGTDAELSNNSGYLVLGDVNSSNLVFDNNEILARNNGANNTLFLQYEGGALEIGGTAAKPGGGSWSAASDARLKQNILPYKDGLAQLQKINPVYFNYNSKSGYDTTKQFIGVLAQELQGIAPYMVNSFLKKDTEYLNVDNTAMTYMLINAVKEQQDKIVTLEAKLLEFEKLLKALGATAPLTK